MMSINRKNILENRVFGRFITVNGYKQAGFRG
jgi:hypothetical protein